MIFKDKLKKAKCYYFAFLNFASINNHRFGSNIILSGIVSNSIKNVFLFTYSFWISGFCFLAKQTTILSGIFYILPSFLGLI